MKNMKTEGLQFNSEVKAILDGIPDIIKVYKTDHTVSFFNKAGYEFYKKTYQEVLGHKCYEVLNRNVKCTDCSFGEVIKTKKKISKERYIPELNKVMDVCYTPILDSNGEIEFVVERLTDITEKKIVGKMLHSSRRKYIQIIEKFPDPLIIISDNKIVEINDEGCNIFNMKYENIIDNNIYKFFDEKYIKLLHKKLRDVIVNYKEKEVFQCELKNKNGEKIDLQIILSFMIYKGKSAVMAVMRDITQIKRDLKKAADFQNKSLQKDFPGKKYAQFESVYVPANIVSGDFYRICDAGEGVIIGIVIDVRGKGISAALNLSALDVLFLQEIGNNKDPINIVRVLNKKLFDYYDENYIAVCCFKIDFNKMILDAVGAGVNSFFYKPANSKCEEILIKGPFLGMFDIDEMFEKTTIKLNKGDELFFFSDGFDFIINENTIINDYINNRTIKDVKEQIDKCVEDEMMAYGKLKDDCTIIAMEIK